MVRRRIDVVRLGFLLAGCIAGIASVTVGFARWKPDAELLSSAAGVFATLTGFVLTVQTIAVSSSIAREDARKAEILFRVKRLYFFFVVNLSATAAGLIALALKDYGGPISQAANGALLFIAPFALVTATELPRTLWSNHR